MVLVKATHEPWPQTAMLLASAVATNVKHEANPTVATPEIDKQCFILWASYGV